MARCSQRNDSDTDSYEDDLTKLTDHCEYQLQKNRKEMLSLTELIFDCDSRLQSISEEVQTGKQTVLNGELDRYEYLSRLTIFAESLRKNVKEIKRATAHLREAKEEMDAAGIDSQKVPVL